MSNYQRLISYIYTYEGGIKGKNIGFAKLETRGTQCRITVSVKKIFVGGNPMGVYLLSEQKELKIGTLFVRNGVGEFRATVNSSDVENSGLGIEAFYGLSVHDVESAWRSYTTIWEDAVAHAAEVELADVTAENIIKKQKTEESEEEQALESVLPISREIEEELERESGERGVTERDVTETGVAETGGGQVREAVFRENEADGIRESVERPETDGMAGGFESETSVGKSSEFVMRSGRTNRGQSIPWMEETETNQASDQNVESRERRPEWRRPQEKNRNWSKTAVRNLRESLMRDQAAISAAPAASQTPDEMIQDPGPVIYQGDTGAYDRGQGTEIPPPPQGPGPEIPSPPQGPGLENPWPPQGPGPEIPSPPQGPGPENPWPPQGPGPEIPSPPQGPGPEISPEPEIHTPQGPEPEIRPQVQEAAVPLTEPSPVMRQNQAYPRGGNAVRRPFGTPPNRNGMGNVNRQNGVPNQQLMPISEEEPPADSIPSAKEEKDSFTQEEMWGMLRKKYPKVLAFDYADGCEILSIKPQDIGLLPRETWLYGNNSFLLHGYYNYRYLILARLNNPKGKPRYLLGIPGHYYSNEKYMAAMFGFPDFVLSKKQPSGDGRFGYWYTDVKVGE